MSKLVSLGHWLAAAILGTWGLRELMLSWIEPNEFGYRLTGAILYLLPALGILFWNRFALGAAIGVCAFDVARSVNGPFAPDSRATCVAMALTLGLVLLWLITPNVRRRFRGHR
jgi:hypothetical protein